MMKHTDKEFETLRQVKTWTSNLDKYNRKCEPKTRFIKDISDSHLKAIKKYQEDVHGRSSELILNEILYREHYKISVPEYDTLIDELTEMFN